jgi:hypothetical protein
MDRLEPVAHVGQRARDDDAHRVLEERRPQFLFDVDRQDPLVRHLVSHVRQLP